MIIKGKSLETVFIMGAGATRGAVGHVRVKGKLIRPPLNSDYFKIADSVAAAYGAHSPHAKRLKRLRNAFKNDLPVKGDPRMEEAFSLLYMAKDFPEIYKSGPGRRPRPGIREEIDDFLRLLFLILGELDSGSANTGYDRLAKCLEGKDTIITLNYDTVLDSALARRGWNPQNGYCLGGGKRKVEWRPRSVNPDQSLGDVRLLKLHGSINWWIKGDVGNLSRIFDSKPSRVTGVRKSGIEGHIRQIVPPIYGKVFGHSHWRGLWTHAFRALVNADILVVVGCSLVDTDFHLTALLRRIAATRRANGKFKRGIFVDLASVRRRWSRLMKGAFLKADGYKTFEQFLAKELSV